MLLAVLGELAFGSRELALELPDAALKDFRFGAGRTRIRGVRVLLQPELGSGRALLRGQGRDLLSQMDF